MIKVGDWTLLPAIPGTCPECAVDHKPDQPHNAQSLYYQYRFFGLHGRWPNWIDAMAHCTDEIKQHWALELKKHGADMDPAAKSAYANPYGEVQYGKRTQVSKNNR